MAYVLSLDGIGHAHDKPKRDLLRMDWFFSSGFAWHSETDKEQWQLEKLY